VAARIQVNGGAVGVGSLACPHAEPVALTDAGGGTPTSRQWVVTYWPAPLLTPPTLSTPTTSSSGFSGLPGTYVIQLTRVESTGATTTQSVLVGIEDVNGNVLPSPGVPDALYGLLGNSPAFASHGAYVTGESLVTNDNPTRVYGCVSGGTDAGSSGPTGTGSTIVVGGLTWQYLGTASQQVAAAATAGWSGSAFGGTPNLMDAALRDLTTLAPGTAIPDSNEGQIGYILAVASPGVAAWEVLPPGFNAGADLGGTSADQTVVAIQGLPTVGSAEAVSGNVAQVLPSALWVEPTGISWDGTHLWVLDGEVNTATGHVSVYETDGATFVTPYGLDPSVTLGLRILYSSAAGYNLVGVQNNTSNTYYLYVVNTSGAVIGIGSFPGLSSSGCTGLAFDSSGNVWTADATYGLQCFNIASMVSRGLGTPTPPTQTLAFSGCADVCFDGTYLYACAGTTLKKVNASTATVLATATASTAIAALFYHASTGPSFYASAANATALFKVTSALAITTVTSSGSGSSGFGRLNTDGGGTYVYVARSPGVDVFNITTPAWYAQYATLAPFSSASVVNGLVSDGSSVWCCVAGSSGVSSGLQQFTSAGPSSLYVGPLSLAYAAGTPSTGLVLGYNGTAWVATTPSPATVSLVSETVSTTSTSAVTVGSRGFDPSAYASVGRTIKLWAVAQVASASDTLTISLVDASDTTTIATLTTTSTVAVELSTTLTVSSAGSGTLANSRKLYYATIQRTGGVSSDGVTIHSCSLEVTY